MPAASDYVGRVAKIFGDALRSKAEAAPQRPIEQAPLRSRAEEEAPDVFAWPDKGQAWGSPGVAPEDRFDR